MSELRKINLTKMATLMDQFVHRIDDMYYPESYTYFPKDVDGVYEEHIQIETIDCTINVVDVLGFDEEGTLFFKDFDGIEYHMEFFDKLTTYSLLDEGL